MMTNVEIKLGLAKALLMSGNAPKESLDKLYKWVVDENSEIDFNEESTKDVSSCSILEVEQYIRKHTQGIYGERFASIIRNNNIKTVGDLLALGRRGFLKIRGVGNHMITYVQDTLEDLYGIKGW